MQQLVEIMKKGRLLIYKKGEIVTQTDDLKLLYLVKRGYVKRYQITNMGTISIQSLYGPMDVFPLTYVYSALFDKKIYIGPEEYFYEAINSVALWALTMDELKDKVNNTPQLYRGLLSVAGDRFLTNIQQLENLSLDSATKRVAHLLLSLSYSMGEDRNGGRIIKAPLTQQDLADMLSLTRESVSTAFNVLKKYKLVDKRGKHITILQTNRLKELVYS